MSLVICSSAQDKYQSVGNLVSNNGQVLPSSVLGPGIQNPAQFTNNINPVMKIPPNSEVALKDMSFYKSAKVVVGINTNMAVYVGELLRGRWGSATTKSLDEVTSCPISIPLQPGTYTSGTFAIMLQDMLNQYISYPDLKDNIEVVPWSSRNDGDNKVGYVFNFKKGSVAAVPADRSGVMTNVYALPSRSNHFEWNDATKTYTSKLAGLKDNIAVFTNMPLSLNGGEMKWDTTGCPGGWRITLTRPITPFRPAPYWFNSGQGDLGSSAGYGDIILEFARRTDRGYTDAGLTFRIFHSVFNFPEARGRGTQFLKEVQYYNNVNADFTPTLSSYWVAGAAGPPPVAGVGEDHLPMYRTTATTLADLQTAPTSVSITVSGEDTRVTLTRAATATPNVDAETLVMTDSRLCVDTNATLIARTPTRNRFIKPLGTTCNVLYPKISLGVLDEFAVLTTYNGIGIDTYQYPLDQNLKQNGTGDGTQFPASPTGADTSGSSVWGRTPRFNVGAGRTGFQEMLRKDSADPYRSGLVLTAQKQYVGLDGPAGQVPPVRVGEGSPLIPAVAVGTGQVAYSVAIITMPTDEKAWGVRDEDNRKIRIPKGVYAIQEVSDVSDLLGFENTSLVAQTIMGNSYLYANKPSQTSSAPPANTLGAFFGWYVGSTSVPNKLGGGSIFVRCPTLTHQSYNFGKGIPSKIIATIPSSSMDNTDAYGEGFFAPSEMTYLTLNNTETLNFNDLTLELVDKNEKIIENFQKNTTITLHFRKSK